MIKTLIAINSTGISKNSVKNWILIPGFHHAWSCKHFSLLFCLVKNYLLIYLKSRFATGDHVELVIRKLQSLVNPHLRERNVFKRCSLLVFQVFPLFYFRLIYNISNSQQLQRCVPRTSRWWRRHNSRRSSCRRACSRWAESPLCPGRSSCRLGVWRTSCLSPSQYSSWQPSISLLHYCNV